MRQVVRITGPEKADGANRFRILLHDDVLLAGDRISADGENLVPESPVLGRCAIPLRMIREPTMRKFEVSRYPDPYRDRVPDPGRIE